MHIYTHTHTPCYVNSDENETETLTGITRQDIKLQMKWLGLFMKFLGTLTYTLGIMFYYPENNCVRQLFGPGGTRCHNFYCIPSDNCPICSFQPQVISMNILVDVWRWAGQRLLPWITQLSFWMHEFTRPTPRLYVQHFITSEEICKYFICYIACRLFVAEMNLLLHSTRNARLHRLKIDINKRS